MKLIVGLGNPGKEYAMTRHNCGFRVIDAFADAAGVDIDKEAFKGIYGRFKYNGEDIILFKPLTMMNLSGNAVQEIDGTGDIERVTPEPPQGGDAGEVGQLGAGEVGHEHAHHIDKHIDQELLQCR